MDTLPPGWSMLQPPDADPFGEPAAAGAAHQLPVLAALGVALLGVAVVAAAVLLGSRTAPGTVMLPADGSAASAPDEEIVVQVGGAVRHPGLVRIPAGSRVADAIAAAGGYSAAVDAAAVARDVHLAQPVADGGQVIVPGRGDPPPAAARSRAGSAACPIDVNTASESELETLPGVGPVTAAKIVQARSERPFASVDDLAARKVVGPATLAKIRDLIVVH